MLLHGKLIDALAFLCKGKAARSAPVTAARKFTAAQRLLDKDSIRRFVLGMQNLPLVLFGSRGSACVQLLRLDPPNAEADARVY